MIKVFDGHCDTLSRCYRYGTSLRKNEGHLDLERMHRGNFAQFFATFASAKHVDKPIYQVFLGQLETFQRQMAENADWVVHCRTAQQAEEAWKAGKTAAFLSVEGAELLDCDIEKLEDAYQKGVRAVNLTWNHVNALSGTNVDQPEKGLTPQGKAFAARMQELGMLVDVSHLSDPGFWDVIELAKKPIFASHSNSRVICGHPRKLTDEMFTALIKNGGVTGFNMGSDFVGEDPGIDTIIAHIEHWLSLGGEQNISLGGDWDGVGSMPKGITGIQDLEKLAEKLLQMNYSEALVEALFYRNLMRVVGEVCTA